MKIKEKYEYDAMSVNLKLEVFKRFIKLSRKLSKPQSETLNAMNDLFVWNGFSPFDRMENSL